MAEDFEVLSALLDREPIDIAQLEAALEDRRGRQALVDFVELRQTVAADAARPRPAFYARVAPERSWPRRMIGRRVPLPLAVVAVLLAWLTGTLLNRDANSRERPSIPPPDVTRVLRFEPGVDWNP